MKKVLKAILFTIMTLLTIAVLYTAGYRSVFTVLENRSVLEDRDSDFSAVGGGISWIKPGNKRTLFFIPALREGDVENLYGSWLRELHEKQGVNVIVPPLKGSSLSPSLTSPVIAPDDRTAALVHLFDVYSSMVAGDHKITVLSTGDGSIQALELARGQRGIDKVILLSPLHGNRVSGGNLFISLSRIPFLDYAMPWLPESYGKRRAGHADILNDELNGIFEADYGKYYPDYINTIQEAASVRAAVESLKRLNEVKSNRFFIIYGDDDLTCSLEGYERMGDALEAGGSEVSIMRLASSGRMVLFDNERERIIDLIAILLQ